MYRCMEMYMKRWIAVVMMTMLTVTFTGCQDKVITVADVQPKEEEAVYIEMKEFALKEKEEDSHRENVKYCAVMIPAGYHESEEIPGMYLHERTPLDSSNIYYTVSEGAGEGLVSESLTKESYQQVLEEAFEEGGQEVSVSVESFEEIDMDGIPALKIRSSYSMADNTIEQLTYLILAEDTYTVTYSQADDDELMADFEISDGEIKLVKEESVELATTN